MTTKYSSITQEQDIPSDQTLDAFGRSRSSLTSILLDAQHHYGQMHQNFVARIANAATVVDSPANSSLTLNVTASAGSKITNRSRRVYYIAGQSQLISLTGNFYTTPVGIVKRIGYFDDDDGIFFENDSGIVSIVLRTSTSGTPSDANKIAQSQWNVDKMDGTGPSGVIVDWTKAQIFVIDLQWLGVGRVRCYLNIDGQLYMVHQFLHANNVNAVYMQTAHLPCTYEIENVSSASASSMMQICSSISTEGNIDPFTQIRHAVSCDTTLVSLGNGVMTHMMSIRPAALFRGRTNKGMIIPLEIEISNTGNITPLHFHVLEDSVLSTPTWVAVNNIDSMVEASVGTAAGITTLGRSREEGYVLASNKGGIPSTKGDYSYKMQLDVNNVPDILTIAAEGVGGITTAVCKISFLEIY